MTRLFPIWLFLAACCHAGTIKITFTFQLEQWAGKVVYDNQMPGELPNPTPDCKIELWIDQYAADTDPDTTRGLYTSAASHIRFTFGPFSEDHQGATVEVLSNHQNLWGIFFRNKLQCSAYGVYRPANTGIYAFYTSVDPMVAPYVVPSDALGHLLTAQGHSAFINGTHAYHNGVYGYPPTFIHAEADNVISRYTAEIVP